MMTRLEELTARHKEEQGPMLSIYDLEELVNLQMEELSRCPADVGRLICHFRNTDVYEGNRGDLDNASPGQSAIRVMVERKQKIQELRADNTTMRLSISRCGHHCRLPEDMTNPNIDENHFCDIKLQCDLVEQKQKIAELEAERNVILTMLGPDYAGEFEAGDKQRPLDSLVSEVLSRLRRAECILVERDWQDDKWGPQDHSLFEWVVILTEEVGELSAAALGHTFGTDKHPNLNWRKEAVQVAAVALAMLEESDD